MTTLTKRKVFPNLKLAEAYQQLPVDDMAAHAQKIITYIEGSKLATCSLVSADVRLKLSIVEILGDNADADGIH